MMDAKDAVLQAVADGMESLGLTYAYDRITAPTYPYFVGSFREMDDSPESGRTDGLMTLTGWDKAESAGRLLDAAARVKGLFGNCVARVGGFTVATSRAGDYELPVDDANTKRVVIQIATRTYGK